MSNPWFRMYHEWATDPKIQMLSEADQRRFVMILCFRCCNGDVTLHDEEVAFQLRIDSSEWADTKAVLLQKNLINEDNTPTNWDKRQFASDSSKSRVAAYRERKKKGRNGGVTLHKPRSNRLDTESDTESDTDKKKEIKPLSTKVDRSGGVDQVFEFWQTECNHPSAKLDKKRKSTIAAALRLGYTVEQLCNAISGMMNTPHNIGMNDRNTVFDGIHIVFKDADQIDRFIRNYHNPPSTGNKQQKLEGSNRRVADQWATGGALHG